MLIRGTVKEKSFKKGDLLTDETYVYLVIKHGEKSNNNSDKLIILNLYNYEYKILYSDDCLKKYELLHPNYEVVLANRNLTEE